MFTIHRLPLVRKCGQTVWTNSIKYPYYCFLAIFKVYILRPLSYSPLISFSILQKYQVLGKRKSYHLLRNEYLPKRKPSTFILSEKGSAFIMFGYLKTFYLKTLFEYLKNVSFFPRLTPSLVRLWTLLILNHFCLVILTCFLTNVSNSLIICGLSFCCCILKPFIISSQPKS